jgi:hypothetical protein
MNPGDRFIWMLVPNGTIQQVYENPGLADDKRPLFSLADANPENADHIAQRSDSVGNSTTFAMEDGRRDAGSDRDFNDLVFRIEGATGFAPLLKDVVAPQQEWQYGQIGQAVLSYISGNDNPEKSVPNKPTPDPILPIPVIPQTAADQGGNSLVAATLIEPSTTQDLVDQVSAADPMDLYRGNSQILQGAQLEVLQGQIVVSYVSISGEVLGRQTIPVGTHSLSLPNGVSGDLTLKIESVNSATSTYVLSGFESKALEPFNIEFEFGNGLTSTQQAILEAAARSIEGMIGRGLPSAIVDGKIIDDLKVKLSLMRGDGLGGTLAQTKIDFMRYGTLLPAQSIVQLDIADIADLERSGQLFSVVQHELLHALGFGNLWEAKGLVDYAQTPFARYTGEQALAAFQGLGGSTPFIPLETTGQGSADLHWNDALFQGEVMTTAPLNSQDPLAPISAVTLASLADLGYAVNLDRVTPGTSLLGSTSAPSGFFFSDEEKQKLAELIAAAEAQADATIPLPIVIPPVDASTISPTIVAHAERFDINGEYYDWEPVVIRWGDTISQYVLDRMTHPSSLDPRSPDAKFTDPRYWQFIVDRNTALGVQNPNVIFAGKQIYLPIWHPNYEQEREEERLRREAELRDKEKAEKAERDKLIEAYRQSGQGGLDWYLSKPLPDFSTTAPYESSIRDLVGSLVPDDYFRFTVSRPGYVTLYLEDLLADADLYLYDSRNRLIAKSARSGVTDEKIIANLAAGTYLARVHSASGVTTDYNLKVRFDGIPSRTQVGSGAGTTAVGRRTTFSDPRLEQLFVTARDKFTREQWAAAQPKINALEEQKRQKQQELDALLAQAVAEQKAKIYGLLDGVKDDVQGKVSGGADNVTDRIDNLANGTIWAVDALVPNWLLDKLDWMGLGGLVRNAQSTLRDEVNGSRDWLNSQVNWVRDQINGAVGNFIELVKDAYVTGGEINRAIEDAANWLKGETDKLSNALNDKIGEFKGWLLGKMEGARNIRIPEWARNLGVPDWNLYDHAIVGLVNNLAGGANNTVNGLSSFFKGTVDVVKPLAQGAVAVIVDAIFGDKTGHLYNEINGVNQEITDIRNTVQKTINDQTSFYQKILNDFLGGIGQAKAFITGALMGEFNDNPSIWQSLLDTAIGMIPVVGEIGDIRDLIAYIDKFAKNPNEMNDPWNWIGVAGAGIGLVPVVGGAIKGVTKLARSADFIQEVRKLAPPIVEAIIDFARKADWNALSKQTSNLFDEALGTVENILTDLSRGIAEFKRLMPQLGLQFQPVTGKLPDEGFFDSIKNNVQELRRKTPEQIDKGFAFIQRRLDELTRSPGKFMGDSPFKSIDDLDALGGHSLQRHRSSLTDDFLRRRAYEDRINASTKFDSETVHLEAVNAAWNDMLANIRNGSATFRGGRLTCPPFDIKKRIGYGYYGQLIAQRNPNINVGDPTGDITKITIVVEEKLDSYGNVIDYILVTAFPDAR